MPRHSAPMHALALVSSRPSTARPRRSANYSQQNRSSACRAGHSGSGLSRSFRERESAGRHADGGAQQRAHCPSAPRPLRTRSGCGARSARHQARSVLARRPCRCQTLNPSPLCIQGGRRGACLRPCPSSTLASARSRFTMLHGARRASPAREGRRAGCQRAAAGGRGSPGLPVQLTPRGGGAARGAPRRTAPQRAAAAAAAAHLRSPGRPPKPAQARGSGRRAGRRSADEQTGRPSQPCMLCTAALPHARCVPRLLPLHRRCGCRRRPCAAAPAAGSSPGRLGGSRLRRSLTLRTRTILEWMAADTQ